MILASITPVNSLLTTGKWTYVKVDALSLHTGERGVYHPSKACDKLLQIPDPKYQAPLPGDGGANLELSPNWVNHLNINISIHNNRCEYILSTVHCLIFVYISFQICLIFLSK